MVSVRNFWNNREKWGLEEKGNAEDKKWPFRSPCTYVVVLKAQTRFRCRFRISNGCLRLELKRILFQIAIGRFDCEKRAASAVTRLWASLALLCLSKRYLRFKIAAHCIGVESSQD